MFSSSSKLRVVFYYVFSSRIKSISFIFSSVDLFEDPRGIGICWLAEGGEHRMLEIEFLEQRNTKGQHIRTH